MGMITSVERALERVARFRAIEGVVKGVVLLRDCKSEDTRAHIGRRGLADHKSTE